MPGYLLSEVFIDMIERTGSPLLKEAAQPMIEVSRAAWLEPLTRIANGYFPPGRLIESSCNSGGLRHDSGSSDYSRGIANPHNTSVYGTTYY